MAEYTDDILTYESVIRHLSSPVYSRLDIYDSVVSTNTLLREKAALLPDNSAVIASCQTGGRGRRGRSFFSPAGTGIYLSILLAPHTEAVLAADLTTLAAVAVCLAIESTLGLEPRIKWVNDVLLDGRKVCGILTEAISVSGGIVERAIVGIGVNVYQPEGGFPEELRGVAGALTADRRAGLRGQLAAALLNSFAELYTGYTERGTSYIDRYRQRSAVIGKEITVLSAGGDYRAHAVDIDERCRLIVETPDGSRRTLSSGEISVRLTERIQH